MDILIQQYDLVKSSRQVLLAFCEQLPADEFVHEFPNFGRGSIRNLLVHNANTYVHWLQKFATKSNTPYFDPADVLSVADAAIVYKQIDEAVLNFIDQQQADLFNPLTSSVPGNNKILTLSPLTLFTHVITHEFHHKGQILTMCRQFGHIPVDTDIIR